MTFTHQYEISKVLKYFLTVKIHMVPENAKL